MEAPPTSALEGPRLNLLRKYKIYEIGDPWGIKKRTKDISTTYHSKGGDQARGPPWSN